jgi:hypothetical protein
MELTLARKIAYTIAAMESVHTEKTYEHRAVFHGDDTEQVVAAIDKFLATIPEIGALTDLAIEARDHLYDKQDMQRVRDMAKDVLASRPTPEPVPSERTFTLKQLRDAGRDTGCSDAVEEVIAVLNPPPTPAPDPQCTGPFSDDRTCPVHSRYKQSSPVLGPAMPTVTKLEYPEAPQDDALANEEVIQALQIHASKSATWNHSDHFMKGLRAVIEFARRGWIPRTESTFTAEEVEKAVHLSMIAFGVVVGDNLAFTIEKDIYTRLTAPTKQQTKQGRIDSWVVRHLPVLGDALYRKPAIEQLLEELDKEAVSGDL